ncbi:MAG: hypothetical protein V1745_04380 [Patescibacteria group bacterium]
MMIVTRPEHDIATKYLACWSEAILDEAKCHGVRAIDLRRKKANRKEFEGRVRKLNPKLLVLHGHGNKECVTGHDNEVLLRTGENSDVLVGKITYAVSCDAAFGLGAEVAGHPDTAFIGYDDKFVFSLRQDKLHHPLRDDRARPFMEMSNQVAISLVKGQSCINAHHRSQAVGKAHFRKLLSSASDPDALMDARNLWWDMKHQVCLGDVQKNIT